jgi:3-hydroxyisobutyrate dehydrogenase-like beta-hydroxyacid dehydrogenase
MTKKVGVIGLGAMGSAMALRMIKAGYDVVGTDVRQACMDELAANGGKPATSARAVAEVSDIIIISLASEAAFHAVTTGADSILDAKRGGTIVVDTCTLAITDKAAARDKLKTIGVTLLDCTVSGTRPIVLAGNLTLYASGDAEAFGRAEEPLKTFTRSRTFLGEFGNASKLKYVMNFLVLIHNAATAEAMSLARKSGLDLTMVQPLVDDSFGSSKVWGLRGKMMVERDYVTSRGTYGIARKDARVIGEFARSIAAPTPIFQAALQMHLAAISQGYGDNDTASLFEIYSKFSGLEAVKPQKPVIN